MYMQNRNRIPDSENKLVITKQGEEKGEGRSIDYFDLVLTKYHIKSL